MPFESKSYMLRCSDLMGAELVGSPYFETRAQLVSPRQALLPTKPFINGGPMNSSNDNASLRGGASGEGHQSDQPIRFAGAVLGAKHHICAFFHNRDEEYRVLLPFIKDGLKRGEKA